MFQKIITPIAMKKSIKIALIALISAVSAYASPVSQQRACDIARSYVSQMSGAAANLSINGVENLDGLYLVNFSPRGFAIVCGDDNCEPILGYSTSSNLRTYQIPDNMYYILTLAQDMVKLNAVSGNVNPTWNRIESGAVVKSRADEEPVDILIPVNFNQTAPFNQYCPGTGSNQAIVGCVAVSMSQAMSVQKYPARPSGQVTYGASRYGQISIDYDKEAPYDWNAILKGTNNYSEAARLLYHAGVSVFMEYGTDGSGVPSNQLYRIVNALKNNFGYGNTVRQVKKDGYTGNWEELLLNELYAGNAIIFNAIDSKGGGGHSFNLDGYDGRLFHVNWGWGGYGDGYFSITNLNYMDMAYNVGQEVVIGVGGVASSIQAITLPDTYVEENQPAGTIVSALLVNGDFPGTDYQVNVTGRYNASIGYEETPFEYKDGVIVTKQPLSTADSPLHLRIEVKNKVDGTKMVQNFNIEVEKAQTIAHRTSIKYDRGTKKFTVHTKYTSSYRLYNAQGIEVANGTVGRLPEFDFLRSQLTDGVNILQITQGGNTASLKIVK